MNIDTTRLAQLLGLFCAIVAAGVLTMFGTWLAVTGREDVVTSGIFFGLAMLAGVAGWASATNRPFWLLIAWFVSFVPAGFWLMLMPSWVRIAGFAQLGFLFAAVALLKNRKRLFRNA